MFPQTMTMMTTKMDSAANNGGSGRNKRGMKGRRVLKKGERAESEEWTNS
jgi:hypothetical protein